MSNSITSLELYRTGAVWAFDDEARGLQQEALISGSEDIIDTMVPPEINTCTVLFSAQAFPGSMLALTRQESESGGTWYVTQTDEPMRGWLCPSLFLYFDKAPEELHIQIKVKK
jgi:hypothetical protein